MCVWCNGFRTLHKKKFLIRKGCFGGVYQGRSRRYSVKILARELFFSPHSIFQNCRLNLRLTGKIRSCDAVFLTKRSQLVVFRWVVLKGYKCFSILPAIFKCFSWCFELLSVIATLSRILNYGSLEYVFLWKIVGLSEKGDPGYYRTNRPRFVESATKGSGAM